MRRILFVFFSALLFSSLAFGQKSESDFKCPKGNICGQLTQVMDMPDDEEVFLLQADDQKLYQLDGNLYDLKQAVGQRVAIVGRMRNDRIHVRESFFVPKTKTNSIAPFYGAKTLELGDDASDRVTPEIFTVPGPTLGDRKIIVVRVLFEGDPMPTEQEVAAQTEQLNFVYFSQTGYAVNNFYRVSTKFARFSITGVVHPVWVRIPHQPTDCASNMFNLWTNSVSSLMTGNPEWDAARTKVLIFRPIVDCNLNGYATVGSKGDPGFIGNVWMQMTDSLTMNNFRQLVITSCHEIGHNIGVALHSGGITPAGVISDSADRADFVASRLKLPNIYNRLAFGWFVGKVVILSGPQVYTTNLVPPDMTSKQTQGIVIQLRNADGSLSDRILLLEVRRISEFDDFSSQYIAYSQGLAIRFGLADMTDPSARSLILDTTPDTLFGFDDAPLAVGRTYVIPEYGVTIEYIQRTMALGARVRVTMTR